MELLIEPGRCSVCRLDPGRPWPTPRAGTRLYSVTRTVDELSVVCAEGDEPADARVESGWRALRIVGPLVLVKDEDLDRAVDVLGGAGHRVTPAIA